MSHFRRLQIEAHEPDDFPRIIVYVATVNRKEVGRLSFWPGRRRNSPVRIDKLFVDADYRRRGVASALYDRLLKDYGGNRIINGFLTNDGRAWWSGYRNTRHVRHRAR